MATWADRLAIIRNKLEETTAGVWADATLLDDYNFAQKDIARKVKFRLQKSQYTVTATSTGEYARPDYDLEPESVVRGITPLAREDPFDFAGANVLATGTPAYYTVLGGSVYFRPIPNLSATIDYWSYRYPAPLVNATSTVTLPDEYLPIADAYVMAQAYAQVGDFDSYRLNTDRYNMMLNDAISQQGFQSQADMPRTPREVY